MDSQKQVLTFRQSIVSIVLASVVTSGLIAVEKHHRNENRNVETTISKAFLPTTTFNQIGQELTLIAHANRLEVPSDGSPVINSTVELARADVAKQKVEQTEKRPERLLFAFDSYRIQPVYYDRLAKIAEVIKNANDSEQNVWQVIGYADPSGDFLYNLSLSEKRAQNVADFLVSEGVPEEQLSVVSLGASQSEDGITDQSLVERRVEIQPYHQEITTLATQLAKHKREIQIARYKRQHTKMLIDDVIAQQHKQASAQQVLFDQSFVPLAIAMEF